MWNYSDVRRVDIFDTVTGRQGYNEGLEKGRAESSHALRIKRRNEV